jgi:hypothetical protein
MLQDMLKDKWSDVRSASADDLLAALGLERRRSPIAMIGSTTAVLAAGMIVGAGAALLFAPKSGRALRNDLRVRASDMRERLTEKAEEIRSALPAEERVPQPKENINRRV